MTGGAGSGRPWAGGWLEDGRKLRVDTTVVQTNIHHPTDNTLLWDVVRVVTRLVARLAAALERRRIKGFRTRERGLASCLCYAGTLRF
jgi:transposase, IS5 family